MVVSSLKKDSDKEKAFSIFLYLRKKIPNVDVAVLRHVSVYLARTNDMFVPDKDLRIVFYNDDLNCLLLLNDESEIRLVNDPNKLMNFEIDKKDGVVSMSVSVLKVDSDELSPVNIKGEVICGDWKYIVSNDNNRGFGGFIETYKAGELIEKSDFHAMVYSDISLDSIGGLRYITDVMVISDWLYQGLRNLKTKKKKRVIN